MSFQHDVASCVGHLVRSLHNARFFGLVCRMWHCWMGHLMWSLRNARVFSMMSNYVEVFNVVFAQCKRFQHYVQDLALCGEHLIRHLHNARVFSMVCRMGHLMWFVMWSLHYKIVFIML